MPTSKKKNETWAKSKSKALLRAGIISGAITADMKPKMVRAMNPEEHGNWAYDNWVNNLRNLRNAITRDRGRMARDAVAYGQTFQTARTLFPPAAAAKPVWHLTDAPRFLKEDIDDGKNKEMSPRDLHQTRDEYKLFPLKEFRKHIYQEIDCRPKRDMRFERKKNKFTYPELHVNHPRLRENADAPPTL